MTTTDVLVNFGHGVLGALELFVLAGVISLLLGAVLAVLRVSPIPVFRAIGTVYVTIVRNTPLVLLMFFCVFGLPLLAVRFSDSAAINSFFYAVLALGLYTAAFVCEVFRSGIATIPVGQSEAARAIGLGFFQSLRFVVLPQAIRTVLAPLASVMITMLKGTSIASAFNNQEIIYAMKNAIEKRGDIVVPILLGTALVYLALNLLLGRLFTYLEHKAVILR
ncbi:amino acid ABC transporter permease [Brevibacterium litoralis]|uniref:amino acid ABC transporter permease n=1 Tax=Brevibacterium litoralis TaxID=3138935 RepID=UPI0032F06384